jgi:pimeloyl-ACP methyl ester carboxylesterase
VRVPAVRARSIAGPREVYGRYAEAHTKGPARSTPLYLAHRDGILHGSWDTGRLRPYAAERAVATFGGDLFIRYPDPVLHAEPRELADGADVLSAFAEAIDAALDLHSIHPATTVLHLTGGLDSGSIATRAARRWPAKLNTATLIITGPGRQRQVRRRHKILSRVPFGPHDVRVDTQGRSCPGRTATGPSGS